MIKSRMVLKLKKCIAIVMLVSMLTSSVGLEAILGLYSQAVEIENQTNTTQSANVTFDAFFGDSSTNWLTTTNFPHEKITTIDAAIPAILGVKIGVSDGSLTTGKIEFKDLSDETILNYDIISDFSTETTVSSYNDTNKSIVLNTITNQTIAFPINLAPVQEENILLENLTQTSKVVFTGIYTDTSSNPTQISKEIYINLGWTQDSLGMVVEKDINEYVADDIGKEVEIQMSIKVKLDEDFNTYVMPIKQTKLTIDATTFNGIAPTQISVRANSTQATNGKIGSQVKFDATNYSIDLANNKIEIIVNNDLGNGYVFAGHGTDEYVVELRFPKSAFDSISYPCTLAMSVAGEIEYYNSKNSTKKIASSDTANISITEDMNNKTADLISKGWIYGNYNLTLTGRFTFTIDDATNIESIRYDYSTWKFIDENSARYDTYINEINYICLTAIMMDVQSFTSVLGTGGYVNVYNKDNSLLGILNSSCSVNENGYYVLPITGNVQEVYLESSKPVITQVEFPVLQQYKYNPNIPYTKQQKLDFTKLEQSIYSGAKRTGSSVFEYSDERIMRFELQSVESNALLSIENGILDTSKVNENVIFKISFNNQEPTQDDLYTDPIFQIELPKYVTDVNIKDCLIENFSGIRITDYKKITGRNGNIALQITTSGTQSYHNDISSEIVITTNITTSRKTPNADNDVELYFYNKYVDTYGTAVPWNISGVTPDGENGYSKATMRTVAKNEMLCIAEITNYEETGKVVSSVDEVPTDIIEATGTARTAKMKLNIMNNHETSSTDISILGRIPTANNKKVISGDDLGSTVNTNIKSRIVSEDGITGMLVYYSDKADATKDLTDTTNNWTTDVESLSQIKSYLIVLENYSLIAGKILVFSYDFEIPANLNFEDTIFTNFGVYYTLNSESKTAESEAVGLITRKEAEVEFTKTISVGDKTQVGKDQIIEYRIKVKNTNEFDLTDVVIYDSVPDGTVYVTKVNGVYEKDETAKDLQLDVGTLKPGEEKEMVFEVQVTGEKNVTTIRNKASVSANEFRDNVESNEITNEIVEGQNILSVKKEVVLPQNGYVRENQEIEYTITGKVESTTQISNVIITDIIPEGLTYKEAYILKYSNATNSYEKVTTGVNYTDTTRTVIWNVGNLQPQEEIIVKLIVTTDKVDDAKDFNEIKNIAKIKGDDTQEAQSTELAVKVLNDKLEIEKTSNISKTVIKNGEYIKYTINVKNNYTNLTLKNVTVTDILPQGLEYVTSQCTGGRSVQYNVQTNTVSVVTDLAAGEEINIEIMTKVNIADEVNITSIRNKAIVETEILPKKESKVIIHQVEQESEENGVFDLTLDKTVAEITLTNDKGITTYQYDSNLAKIEISEKTIAKSTLIIKYKISVVNIGEEAGYATTIVDNIPLGLEFNSQINTGWYEKNGAIYTNMLKDELIRPGEIKEVYLTLTKTMTNGDGIIIKNTATIAESENVKNISDATPDELSSAEVVVSIRTGATTYILTSLIGIMVLAGGIFVIKRYVII